MKVALANITGNIPCIGFIIGGIELIKHGFIKTGILLLFASMMTVVSYKSTTNKEGEEK